MEVGMRFPGQSGGGAVSSVNTLCNRRDVWR